MDQTKSSFRFETKAPENNFVITDTVPKVKKAFAWYCLIRYFTTPSCKLNYDISTVPVGQLGEN